MLILVDGDDDEVLGEDVNVFGPALDPGVPLFCVAQVGIVFNRVTLTGPEMVHEN